jgi:hypothetical protein
MPIIPSDSRNFRQMRSYVHLCDIWSWTEQPNTGGGVPGLRIYTFAFTGVHCMYQYTANVSDPVEGAGRTKRQSIYTDDAIHFTQDQDIEEGWLIINRSIPPPGRMNVLFGQGHIVLGFERTTPSGGARDANKNAVLAMVLDKLPAGVR